MLGPKQVIPSRTCLSCKFCCRFSKPDTAWQPHLASDEISILTKRGFKNKIFKQTVKLDKLGKIFCCSFFYPQGNSCKVYRLRPFECRLYPFVLVAGKNRISLAVHLACPFILENINTRKFKKHVEYLKRYFARKSCREFIKANPVIAQNYRGYEEELTFLFAIH